MNNIHRSVIRFIDFLLNSILFFALCIVGCYCAYSLWDNQQIYTDAENIQKEILEFKPDTDAKNPSFEELLAINPDVCAWLTLDNTNIDYPVLQGDDNLTYINRDVYGNFALAGSIYLDSRCARDFSGKYSLLYGHHMANNKMFGDLDLYKDKNFFDNNTSGTLLLPGQVYHLEIFACLTVDAGDDIIFEPQKWTKNISPVLNYAQTHSLHLHEDILDDTKEQENITLLTLSTCSVEYEEARTILLAFMKPYK